MVVNLVRGRLVRLGACLFWRQRNQERWTSQRQRHVNTALLQQHTPAWFQKGVSVTRLCIASITTCGIIRPARTNWVHFNLRAGLAWPAPA